MPNDLQSTPYIEFKHVSKSFGDKRILDNVSFDVRAGETVCILGRSGVGKSVSLHHIMGFLKPDSGRVIANRPARDIPRGLFLLRCLWLLRVDANSSAAADHIGSRDHSTGFTTRATRHPHRPAYQRHG